MATIAQSELTKLKAQFNILVRSPGGISKIFDIFYRIVADDSQPISAEYDPDFFTGVGYGAVMPEEEKEIVNGRKILLLSEVPSDKSLWYRLNYELADIILNQEKLIPNTTKDELRIIRAYANTLSEEQKTILLNALLKIEPADSEDKFDLPDISE